MGLPTLKTPRFDLTLPTSGEVITVRPFLIREQKILLQALEMGDISQVNNAINDILRICTFEKVDIDSLPVADVEWLVLQLRAKSVSEKLTLKYTCNNLVETEDPESGEKVKSKCGNSIGFKLDLQDVGVVTNPKHEYTIMVSEDVGMTMCDITYGTYRKSMEMKDGIAANVMLRNSAISSVFDTEQIWSKGDFTSADLDEFLDGLFTKDYEKIEEFLNTAPLLQKTFTIKCPKCGAEEEVTLTGLDDFLD